MNSIKELFNQLGNVLFQEHEWIQTNNSKDSPFLNVNKCIIRHCIGLKTRRQENPSFLQKDSLWNENPFSQTSLLDTCMLPTIQPISTKSVQGDWDFFLHYWVSKNADKRKELCAISFSFLLDWLGTPKCFKKHSNHKEWETWLEHILEETDQAYQLLLYHFYEDWKARNQYLLYPFKSSPFSLEEMSCSTCILGKGIHLKTFSKWKKENKLSTTMNNVILSNSNILHFHGMEYEDPLDDFLDITSHETRDNIEQKYHSKDEAFDAFGQDKKEEIACSLHIPKDRCISTALLSPIQRLMGNKSFILLPPPLEILSVGVVMVYHYLTENQRCLWIAQDEYPFVAALLQNYIGPQLVLDLSRVNKSCCYLCHVQHLSEIPRDEEFSLFIYTVQSFSCDEEQTKDFESYWEICIPFIETSWTSLFLPLLNAITVDSPHPRMISLLQHSDMLLLDIQDTQLDNLLNNLRQTWITFQLSGYQIEGLKMIEESTSEYIRQLEESCNQSVSSLNVKLVDLSTSSIEDTLYKARRYIQEHFQTLQAVKHPNVRQCSSSTIFLTDIQNLIALHTLRTAYDYAQHDGLYAASKYLETAQKRYGSMLPCMKYLQETLQDLGQMDKLLHPKTDLVIHTLQQLKATFEQQQRCLPNFRNVPFRILIITNTRYTTRILKRDLYNRGMKRNKAGIEIIERTNLQDIRPYYAILDISLTEWKPIHCISFHETLSHWPTWIATQLYEWILSQVVQYRCVVLNHNKCNEDSLHWSSYDQMYSSILSRLPRKKSFYEDSLYDYGIYGMEIGTVNQQGLDSLLSYLKQMYPQFSIIFLCCLSTQPEKDRRQMIDLSTRVQMNPHYRKTFSIKFFFHSNDYERWLKGLSIKKYRIVRDLLSAKPPTPHFQLCFDSTEKQTKLQWKATN